MKKPKILLGAPTSEHKDYCFRDWVKHIRRLTWDNLDYYIVDNSENERYHIKVQVSFDCDYVKPLPKERNQDLICRSQNKIREKVLNEGYDFWFSLESDQFPPYNIIEHMLSFRRKIVAIPYFTGRAFESYLLEFEDEGFGRNRLSRPKIMERAFENFDGTLKTTYQCGIGCMLVHRSVLEKTMFHVEQSDPNQAHSDTYFHDDLRKMGVPVFLDTSMICEHRNSNWYKILNKS